MSFSFDAFDARLSFRGVALLLLFVLVSNQSVIATSDHTPRQETIPGPDTLQGCGGPHFSSSDETFEQEVLSLVNQIRLDNGLLPLKAVDSLTSAARFHAADMSEEDYFSHTSHDRVNGELVESCGWDNRMSVYYSGWNSISENIAAGFITPQKVVDGWMNSTGHRQNILSPNNWEIGIGYFKGQGTYSHYWVQDFGRRRNVYPVIINGEDAVSDDGALTIHIYGEWDDVRLRVDEDDWLDWQPFTSPLAWQLKAPAGEHTITIEMSAGTTNATASDSIYLSTDTAEPELNELPDRLDFTYDAASETVSPDIHTIQPLAVEGEPDYTWQVTADDSWLSLSPGQGSGTEIVSIVPVVAGADQVYSDQATITVTLRKSDGTLVAEESIIASLVVAEKSFALFMPVITGK